MFDAGFLIFDTGRLMLHADFLMPGIDNCNEPLTMIHERYLSK